MTLTGTCKGRLRLVFTGAAIPEGYGVVEVTFTTAEYPGQSLVFDEAAMTDVVVFQGRPSRALQHSLCMGGHLLVARLPWLVDVLSEVGRQPPRPLVEVWARPTRGVNQ